MLRKTLSLMLAALLVFAFAGGAVAAPGASGTITVSGRLEYVTNLSAPHYEVAGYVLITQDQLMLQSSTGQEVVVVGTPVTEPSIYMRKAIAVQSLITQSAYIPPSKGDDGTVSLPVIREPQPAPAPADPVTVPVMPPADTGTPVTMPEPLPLWGSPYYILFGTIEAGDGTHLLAQETPTGQFRVTLRSTAVDLSALVGQRVGLVASRDPAIPGVISYNVIAAVVLTGDLSSKLAVGPIYMVPERPITIMLNGKEVAMDQRPILGNGRTLVPLRAIGEALGARVTWNQADQTATVALGDREVKVTVGSNRVVIHDPIRGDVVIYCDIAPVVAGGRTLVPVRVISESLGLKVGWNDATRTVTLN